ncbi:MAG: type II toxin-antitoxin system HigB family toxin [Flavobacteriaceae bacterium]|nr:type II toxin-antitoxin system HigB family toxin [Flavobacteriaceae bacterium]
MRVVTPRKISEFGKQYADAKVALNNWYATVKKCEWDNLSDVRNTFNTVDYVGNNRFVFDIKGNHYRLVAIIIFASKKLYIRFIGTHKEYDKITDIENI